MPHIKTRINKDSNDLMEIKVLWYFGVEHLIWFVWFLVCVILFDFYGSWYCLALFDLVGYELIMYGLVWYGLFWYSPNLPSHQL